MTESKKKAGRPVGSGSANQKLLRVLCTPRQERLLAVLRTEMGLSESEHVRRALDNYLDLLISRGELIDAVADATRARIAQQLAEEDKK